ncbi:restriction endonuclease subunit S [Ihuprevotella massiliensis]|uniref:restriction endonuclease subunit S n=1 Tax=Ihuprevotella massiliensis TaxID=1852368 RepID=UPI00094EC71C
MFITRNGYTPSKSNPEYWEGGTIPWYRMEDIRENGRVLSDALQHITPKGVKGNRLFKADSIILATTATIGEHALITTDALCNQQLTNFEIKEDFKDKLLSKFVFYYFYVIDDWCKKNVNVSSFPSVSVPKLKNLDFPIPPLSEQARIVEILDKFDTLTNSISEGLPLEIQLRKQQYEYYREQLLDFRR